MSGNIYYKLITPFKSKENNKYNYVYQITEISTGKKYIGSRGSTTEPNKDIKKYKSSSTNKQFKKNQKLNPLNYWYEILSYHETREDAIFEEARIHELYNVGCDDKYFNRSKQTKNGFTTAGKINVEDGNGNALHVYVDDERYKLGLLKPISSGTVFIKTSNGDVKRVSVDNEDYKSGKLKHINVGKLSVKDGRGNVYQVSNDNEDYKSGKLKHINVGKVSVKDINTGETRQVSVDDPDYKSGNLVCMASGTTSVRNKNTNEVRRMSLDDPALQTGDWVGVKSGMTLAKDKTGQSFMVSVDDIRLQTGEIVGFTSKWFNINGEVISIKNAAEKYKVHLHTVRSRVKSTDPKWSEWKYA